MELNIVNLNRIDYSEALDIQRRLQQERIDDSIVDTLLVLEHNPVLTLGIRGQYDNILESKQSLKEKGFDIVEVERGGDVTYHGPGQLVLYPIINLEQHGKDIRSFISKLQDVIMNVLRERFDIASSKKTGIHTGVWIDEKKIAAIGISISKWVTMHGVAFNVNTDLSHFGYIVPCGLSGFGVTSIKEMLGSEANFQEVTEDIIKEFVQVFGYDKVNTTDKI